MEKDKQPKYSKHSTGVLVNMNEFENSSPNPMVKRPAHGYKWAADLLLDRGVLFSVRPWHSVDGLFFYGTDRRRSGTIGNALENIE